MKTLVSTLRFGDCNWFPKFVPSLENWCESHGYYLKVWDDPEVWKGYPCPKFCEKDMLDGFLNSDYDRMIYIDADVLIDPKAPEFPVLPGIAVATDKHHKAHSMHFNGWCAALYGREFPLWAYSNAGVWSIDREGAEKLLKMWKPPYAEFFQEQHYFNAAICLAKEDYDLVVSRLPIEWNRWAGDEGPRWFNHFWTMDKTP